MLVPLDVGLRVCMTRSGLVTGVNFKVDLARQEPFRNRGFGTCREN